MANRRYSGKSLLGSSLALVGVTISLMGCAGDDSPASDSADSEEAPAEIRPSPSASKFTLTPAEDPAPTATATSKAPEALSPVDDLRVQCGSYGSRTPAYDSLEELWEVEERKDRERCKIEFAADDFEEYKFSEAESEVADNQDLDLEIYFTKLYENCADAYMGGLHGDRHWYPFDIDSAEAAFLLCPEQPEREDIEATFNQVLEDNSDMIARDAATERGDFVRGGDHLVGEGITAGTWVAESGEGFDGCYWERLDSAGNIIANNFMNSGFRAEVYIAESDYSFSSTRCGGWMRQ